MKAYDDALAAMDFCLSWEHNGIRHTDCLHAQQVNFWRDILPSPLCETMAREPHTSSTRLAFVPGQALPVRSDAAVHRVSHHAVECRKAAGAEIVPRFGRFYPRGILHGVAGVHRENLQPFRCIGVDSERLLADFNHPLSGMGFSVGVGIREVRPKFEEHGGTAVDWLEKALTGPGMQARVAGAPSDFFSGSPFARQDETNDAAFYQRPRLVNHIDDAAVAEVSRLYGRLIRPGSEVLDLMGSWTSHISDDLELRALAVHGMNRDELDANTRATERCVHDLNLTPRAPFADGRFDAVICTVSVEYLTRPFEVFAEVARILKPGGLFIQTFSNRWFPPKVTRLWQELHEFERIGLVLEYFLESGRYTGLQSYSTQGLPRPENDRYHGQMPYSDPVFAVWGHKA
jgi:SAM-dependent methyltransferase